MLTAKLPRVWVRIPQSPAIIPNWYQDVAKGAATSKNSIEHNNEIHNLRVCRSVGKNKMIIGYGFKRNKNVFSLHVCTHVNIHVQIWYMYIAGYSLHTLYVTET